jgi:hypothetical protein
VDPHLDRGLGAIFVVRALDGFDDRHRAVARAVGRVTDLRQTEDRHRADGTQTLDATAEGANLVEHELQRARRLELRIGPTRRHQRRPQQRHAAPFPAPPAHRRRRQWQQGGSGDGGDRRRAGRRRAGGRPGARRRRRRGSVAQAVFLHTSAQGVA